MMATSLRVLGGILGFIVGRVLAPGTSTGDGFLFPGGAVISFGIWLVCAAASFFLIVPLVNAVGTVVLRSMDDSDEDEGVSERD